MFFRHVGLVDDELSPRLRELASTRMLDRARVLGAAMRVAYMVSASMPGVLPKTPLRVERGRLVLRFEQRLQGARRRARVQPPAPARASGRPRAGDGGGVDDRTRNPKSPPPAPVNDRVEPRGGMPCRFGRDC